MPKGHPLGFFLFYNKDDLRHLGSWPSPQCFPKGKGPQSCPASHLRPRRPAQTGKPTPAASAPAPGLVWGPRSSSRTSPFLGEPGSSSSDTCGVVSSWASCNPAEYFPGYLTKLLQNHTAYACDGDHLNLQCPRHSTISVQSAFYGQDYRACSAQQPASQREDGLTCVAPTTLQVLLFRRCFKMIKRFSLSLSLSVYILAIR